MKKILYAIIFLSATTAFPQGKTFEKVKAGVSRVRAEAHLTFLAADEMRGRDTGSPEIAIAANYIEAFYKMYGLRKPAGTNSYFQEVGLQKTLPPKTVDVTLGSDVFKFKTDLLLRGGKSFSSDADFVFVGYGLADDFSKTNVKGKIVVTYSGTDASTPGSKLFRVDSPAKYKLVKDNGGLALIEIINFKDVPWEALVNYMAGSRTSLTGGAGRPK
ncbi:MAG: hypothetical protein WDO14_01395 [Bacteroidota bacterium]